MNPEVSFSTTSALPASLSFEAGEALSSYLIRCALALDEPVLDFMKRLGMRTFPDGDIERSEGIVRAIGKYMGHRLSTMTIKFNHTDLGWLLSEFSPFPWSTRSTGGRPKYRFCGPCLHEEPIAYLRASWRLSFCYVCPHHHILLEEQCLNCGQELDWQMLINVQRGHLLSQCPKCLHRLAHPKRGKVLSDDKAKQLLASEERLKEALRLGTITYYGRLVYGPQRELFLRAFSTALNQHQRLAHTMRQQRLEEFSIHP